MKPIFFILISILVIASEVAESKSLFLNLVIAKRCASEGLICRDCKTLVKCAANEKGFTETIEEVCDDDTVCNERTLKCDKMGKCRGQIATVLPTEGSSTSTEEMVSSSNSELAGEIVSPEASVFEESSTTTSTAQTPTTSQSTTDGSTTTSTAQTPTTSQSTTDGSTTTSTAQTPTTSESTTAASTTTSTAQTPTTSQSTTDGSTTTSTAQTPTTSESTTAASTTTSTAQTPTTSESTTAASTTTSTAQTPTTTQSTTDGSTTTSTAQTPTTSQSTPSSTDSSSSTEPTTTTTTSKPNGNFTCKQEGSFKDDINCTMFYVCESYGGTLEAHHKSCRKGSYFDVSSRSCVRGQCKNVDSTTTSPVPEECESEGFIPDAKNCTIFYKCVSNGDVYDKVKYFCRQGSRFDISLGKCVRGSCSDNPKINNTPDVAETYDNLQETEPKMLTMNGLQRALAFAASYISTQ